MPVSLEAQPKEHTFNNKMEFSRLAYIFGGQDLQDEEPENSVFVQPEKLKAAEQRDGLCSPV